MRCWPVVYGYLLTCLLCIGGGIYAATEDNSRAWTAMWLLAIVCFWGALISTPKNDR